MRRSLCCILLSWIGRRARLYKLYLNLLSFLFAVSGDGESLVSLHFWNGTIALCHIFFAKHLYCDYSGSFIKYCVFLPLFLLLPKLSFILINWNIPLTSPSNPLTFCCYMSWWSNTSIMVTVGRGHYFVYYCMAGMWFFFLKISLMHSEQFFNIRCRKQQTPYEPF